MGYLLHKQLNLLKLAYLIVPIHTQKKITLFTTGVSSILDCGFHKTQLATRVL